MAAIQQLDLPQNRFTIQEFRIPFLNAHHRSIHTVTHYHSEKKIIANPEHLTIRRLKRERKSEEIGKVHREELEKIGSLPDIKCSSRGFDGGRGQEQQRMPSFPSKKLNVNAYRKIEKAINFKYCKKMESLANNILKNKKLFSINNLKNDAIAPNHNKQNHQQHERVTQQKGVHFAIVQKHHIDRIKDQFQIPLELMTQRCHEQQVDNHQVNLQIKNMIRFEFDTQMHFARAKQKVLKKEEKVVKIDAWELDHSRFRPSFYS